MILIEHQWVKTYSKSSTHLVVKVTSTYIPNISIAWPYINISVYSSPPAFNTHSWTSSSLWHSSFPPIYIHTTYISQIVVNGSVRGGTYMGRWKAVRMFFGCFWWCSILPMSVWVKQKSTLCVGGALNHFQSFPPTSLFNTFSFKCSGIFICRVQLLKYTISTYYETRSTTQLGFFSGNHSMPYHIFCIIWIPILWSNS